MSDVKKGKQSLFAFRLTKPAIATLPFKLENFVAAPSIELLNLAKKTDLLDTADYYALKDGNPLC